MHGESGPQCRTGLVTASPNFQDLPLGIEVGVLRQPGARITNLFLGNPPAQQSSTSAGSRA